MKFLKKTIIALIALTTIFSSTLNAQNCENFFMSIANAFENEFQDEIAEALTDLEILQGDAPEKPEIKKLSKTDIAKSKKTSSKMNATKTLDQYRDWKAYQAGAKDRMNEKIDEWQVWWKDEFGSNSASYGPRALNINDSGQNGNLVAGAGSVRMFYTEPNMLYKDVKIKIEKTGGSQKGWVIVCRYHIETPDHAEFVGEVEFDKGKGNIKETQEIVCEDCAGYHFSVKVRKNVGTNNFGYRVSTEGMNPLGEN